MPKKQDNTLPVLTHIIGYFTSFIGPLIILLVAEETHAKNHARTALNWQLSLILYTIISIILILVLIGILGILVLLILDIIFCIMAAVKASEGKLWRYPLSIPFTQIED